MIESIAIAAFALIAVVVILAANRPDTFEIRRATSIAARPEDVFAWIQDFRRWVAWSPWEKLDPALRRTYSGAPAGAGAVYAWEGNG